jgi:hypothetical protein
MVAGFWLLVWGAREMLRGRRCPAWLRTLGERLALPTRLAFAAGRLVLAFDELLPDFAQNVQRRQHHGHTDENVLPELFH